VSSVGPGPEHPIMDAKTIKTNVEITDFLDSKANSSLNKWCNVASQN